MPTHVCLIHLEFFFPESHSLKEKRMRLRKIKDRLRQKFNVATAEIDFQDLWQRALVAVVSVSGEHSLLQKVSDRIIEEVEMLVPGELVHFTVDYF